MTASANEEVVIRFLNEVWNKGNAAAIDELYVPGGTAKGLGKEYEQGPAEFKAFFNLMQSSCNNINIEVKSIMSKGPEVLYYGMFTFVHKATNKNVAVGVGGLGIVENGKIVEAHNVIGFWDMLTQMGAADAGLLPKALLG